MHDGASQARLASRDSFIVWGDNNMTGSKKFVFLGITLALCAFTVPASAQSVSRLPLPAGATTPIASAVTVPPGYTTYSVSYTHLTLPTTPYV